MEGEETEENLGATSNIVLSFLASYGWIVIAGFVTALFFLKSWLGSPRSATSSGAGDGELLRRQKEARQRLQAQLDEAARKHAEKQAEESKVTKRKKEEEIRTSTSQRFVSSSSDTEAMQNAAIMKKGGPRLRGEDYNPLTGSSGMGGFRPSGSSGRSCGPKGG